MPAGSDNTERYVRLHWSIAARCVVVGAVAGLLVSLYRLALGWGADTARAMYAYAAAHPLWILAVVAAAVCVGLALSWAVGRVPMAGGTGIPQAKGVLSHSLKMKALPTLAVRFAGGLLGGLFGLSLGRQGPSVQIGTCAGQFVSDISHRGGIEENCLVSAGAAAGIAAAFSAPLSGMVFCLEEVHRSFSPFKLIAVAAGACTGAAIAAVAFGLRPVINYATVAELPLEFYPLMVCVGVLAGLVGVGANRAFLGMQRLCGHIPQRWRIPLAFVVIVPVGLLLPDVLGGGDNLIALAETVREGLGFLVLLVVAKLAVTAVCFGSGAPGGAFIPTLSVGALTGSAAGLLLVQLGMPADYVVNCAICSMAGMLASTMGAPLTGVVLVVEMSGSFSHVLPVALAAFAAYLVHDLLRTPAFYDTLLDRYIAKHGSQSNADDEQRLFEVAVEPGSALDGAEVDTVPWPQSSIVISIQKAERSVIPRGSVHLRDGDRLIAHPLAPHAEAKKDLQVLACRDEDV